MGEKCEEKRRSFNWCGNFLSAYEREITIIESKFQAQKFQDSF